MNKLDAYKMDGLGNDFIIFDNRKKSILLTKDQIINMSDRKNIGCDQVILINSDKNHDASLKFYNSDGGEISACGNGSRCIAYFLMKEKNKSKTSFQTKAGILYAEMNSNNSVCINIGQPNFDCDKIPLSKKIDNKDLKIKITNNDGKHFFGGFALNVGNPHVIFFVDDLTKFNLKDFGAKVENHSYFPQKCNVTIASINSKKKIKIKVWERGVGMTKACGTAACASAVAGAVLNLTEKNIDVEFESGLLNINWNQDNNIYMTGEVSEIKKISVAI